MSTRRFVPNAVNMYYVLLVLAAGNNELATIARITTRYLMIALYLERKTGFSASTFIEEARRTRAPAAFLEAMYRSYGGTL